MGQREGQREAPALGKPRGVLRPTFSQGQFDHQRQAPNAALADVVEHYWYVSWDLRGLPAQPQATLPHPNVHLVAEQGQARIYGVHQGRFVRQLAGQDRVFGIKFKPGGFYPFYGKPLATLLDQSVDAAACFGDAAAPLARQVQDSDSSFASLCASAQACLQQRLPRPDPQTQQVNTLLAHIAQTCSLQRVEDLMAYSGLNKRALQRLFQKYIGVGPKWVIQRYRLHEAIAQVQSGKSLGWTALALELGYFDQAHFVRDFRQMVGMAPGEYEKSLTLQSSK